MGCQTQKADILQSVANDGQPRPRLTPKGERTRARIVDAAARLIYERGVAGTTLEDIRAAAEVSELASFPAPAVLAGNSLPPSCTWRVIARFPFRLIPRQGATT